MCVCVYTCACTGGEEDRHTDSTEQELCTRGRAGRLSGATGPVQAALVLAGTSDARYGQGRPHRLIAKGANALEGTSAPDAMMLTLPLHDSTSFLPHESLCLPKHRQCTTCGDRGDRPGLPTH